MTETTSWRGEVFFAYPLWQRVNLTVPVIYIFARMDNNEQWVPVYCGKTLNPAKRLYVHERKIEADAHGATHVHITPFKRIFVFLEFCHPCRGHKGLRLTRSVG